MIVCICNEINEAAIDSAISGGAKRPAKVFEACGSKARCGTCIPVIVEKLEKNKKGFFWFGRATKSPRQP